MQEEVPYRSGFIAVVGRPNVGKSTLMNALIGARIAITSSRPETTRKAIRGVMTGEHYQVVLVDTPGIHRPRTLLGQRLNDVVDDSLAEVDAVAFLLPADQPIGPGDRRILERLREQFGRNTAKQDERAKQDSSQKSKPAQQSGSMQDDEWKIPVLAVLTKIDQVSRSQMVEKLIELDQLAHFTQIVPVSALQEDNLEEVKDVFVAAMPEGPQMYPDDMLSEETPEDTIAELIRGAFLEELHDELPHSLAVVVDEILEPVTDEGGNPVAGPEGKARVMVSIYVERDSQKPIIIGKKAEHLVHVKKRLRTAVNRIVGTKAVLDLHVKVAKEWQSNPKSLEKLGF